MSCGTSTTATDERDFELDSDKTEFHWTASLDALSLVDQKTYAADRKYLASIVPRGVAVSINHADPRQHRFVLMRHKLAGKTPENSPQLFKKIDELKARQEARGLAVGAVERLAAEGDLASQHELLPTGATTVPQFVASGVMGSRKDALSLIKVDSSTYDGFGNSIGPMTIVEVAHDFRFGTLHSTGDLAFAENDEIMGDSFLSEIVAGSNTLQESYVLSDAVKIAAANVLAPPAVAKPNDVNGDGVIKICLERNAGDCDEQIMGTLTLKLPLKGSVQVNGTDVVIDQAALAGYRNAAVPPGSIFVTLGTSGGGCKLPVGGQTMSMQTFWQNTTVPNVTTLSWDMATLATNWALFSPNCRLVQDTVYLTMNLVVPYIDNVLGIRGTFPVTITNAPQPRPLVSPDIQIPQPIRITNSCLAAGTLIKVDSSAPRKIEDLQIGERVASPYANGLTITDKSIGTESAAMVRIADARGHQLLMTELHPLSVIDRGMVPAKQLKVGDRVMTEDGPSVLVSVTREPYDGKVYNLKVGTSEEARALATDQTAVFANGFLVGDSQIQSKIEVADVKASVPASPRRLPAAWRQDYQTTVRLAGQHASK